VIALMVIVSVLLIMPYRNFHHSVWQQPASASLIIWGRRSDLFKSQVQRLAFRASLEALDSPSRLGNHLGANGVRIWRTRNRPLGLRKNNPAAYLVADMVFVLVGAAIPVLLIILGWKMGGEHQKGIGKVGMALVGLWHGLLQIGAAIFPDQKRHVVNISLVSCPSSHLLVGGKSINGEKLARVADTFILCLRRRYVGIAAARL
jgi:hypothetical protein